MYNFKFLKKLQNEYVPSSYVIRLTLVFCLLLLFNVTYWIEANYDSEIVICKTRKLMT